MSWWCKKFAIPEHYSPGMALRSALAICSEANVARGGKII
jgi:hypothetical protein